MSISHNVWEPITEVSPSDTFACTYGGPFAQQLQLHRPTIDRFLSIASLDGRVLITESKLKRPQATPDINPDGSVTGKGFLRRGERPEPSQSKSNLYFQVEPDPAGWTIAINGALIADDLLQNPKTNARAIPQQVASRANHFLRIGLKEALLKDKCTLAKDPLLIGRVVETGVEWLYVFLAFSEGNPAALFGLLALHTSVVIGNRFSFTHSKEAIREFEADVAKGSSLKYFCLFRRSVNTPAETLDVPVELDRLLVAYGYLDWHMLNRQPLISASNSSN